MLKKIVVSIAAFVSMNGFFPIQAAPYWNWSKMDTASMVFPEKFNFGVTLLGRTLEGDNSKGEWLASKVGKGVEHNKHYQEDIQLIKQIGMTEMVYVLDWNKIEPSEGKFDEDVLQAYADKFAEAHHNGITVTAALKGLEDPSWFVKKGAFEKNDNIDIFERYCVKVSEALKGTVDRYITFCSPESYAMLAYWNKSHPPFKKNMQLAMDVLANELDAHVKVYNTLKNIDEKVQVGITKHVVQLEPKYFWDRLACSMANTLTNKTIYKFFTKGTFNVSIKLPKSWGGVVKRHRNPLAPNSIDFIGIDYHCHYQMRNFKRIPFSKEQATEIKSLTVYPEGLYYAINEVSSKMAQKLNIPIIITKNGIATEDDDLRRLHNERYIYAVAQAIKDGHNVQGYYHYSLLDACDWGSYDNHFGIFSVDRSTMKRTLKPGASRLIEIAQKHKEMHQ